MSAVDVMTPSVAGLFYPEDPGELRRQLLAFMGSVPENGLT